MRHVVNEVVEQVNPLLHAGRHRLALHLARDVAMVLGDKKRLVHKGLGSTFTVRLPLAQAEAKAPAAATGPQRAVLPVQQRATRILVIDDNQDAANILGELLRALGHEVYVAYAPLEALARCEEIRPETVLLDIGLPEISGYELAAMIRSKLQGEAPRIIAVTGYGQQQDRARSQQVGISAHLTKPVSIEALVKHLHPSKPV